MTSLPEKPYNSHQMTIALVTINSKLDAIQKVIVENSDNDTKWRDEHKKEDADTHNHLHARISGIKNQFVTIGVVCTSAGAVIAPLASYLIKIISGKT